MATNKIRGLVISGITKVAEFHRLCEIVGDKEGDTVTQEDIDVCMSEGDSLVYDDTCNSAFMYFWNDNDRRLIGKQILTYQEFLEKYDEKILDIKGI